MGNSPYPGNGGARASSAHCLQLPLTFPFLGLVDVTRCLRFKPHPPPPQPPNTHTHTHASPLSRFNFVFNCGGGGGEINKPEMFSIRGPKCATAHACAEAESWTPGGRNENLRVVKTKTKHTHTHKTKTTNLENNYGMSCWFCFSHETISATARRKEEEGQEQSKKNKKKKELKISKGKKERRCVWLIFNTNPLQVTSRLGKKKGNKNDIIY